MYFRSINDGNGRLGRLLITSFLVWKKILDEPMLYLSAYPKVHQQEYYDRLMQVRNSGNYDAWVRFFLEGVATVSGLAVQTTRRIQDLERTDTERLMEAGVGHSGLVLMRFLLEWPVLRVKDIETAVGVSYTKANSIVASAERLGMLKQISQGKQNRKYVCQAYIDILSEGTELRNLLYRWTRSS